MKKTAKLFFFCTVIMIFCVLLYIPLYILANLQQTKDVVPGWSININRDIKIYVQPNIVTTIHQPKDVCLKSERYKKNKLFLLIIVCSSTTNFDERQAIRENWGHYPTYLKTSQIFHKIKNRYINYNYTYDLYPVKVRNTNKNISLIERLRKVILVLARALKSKLVNVETKKVPQKRFIDEDEVEEEMLPEYDDINNDVNEQQEESYDNYNEENHTMRLTLQEQVITARDIHKSLRTSYPEVRVNKLFGNTVPDFKVVFMLGLPENDNDSQIQSKIEKEVEMYGDVIQEGFIDSYNNLSLKSVMMLKWLSQNCKESVRYILKTDDDTYIKLPSVIFNLRNRSKEFDERATHVNRKNKEYLLIGDLIYGAEPVRDANEKWYTPLYMYDGRVFPRFLSGTAYVLSAPTAQALYKAALNTHFFHLEDVYITGICAGRALPRIVPRDDPSFTYKARKTRCITRATSHRIPPKDMYGITADMLDEQRVDGCERIRLTQIRRNRLRVKMQTKRPRKIPHTYL